MEENPIRKERSDIWKREGYKSSSSFLKKVLKRSTIYSAYRFVKKSIGKQWARFCTEKGKEIFNELNSRPETLSVSEAILIIGDIAREYVPPLVDQIATEKGVALSEQFRKAIVEASAEEAVHAMTSYVYSNIKKKKGKAKQRSSRRRRKS